jgi:dipeptidyl aminopeptidase/acylaminoacyl peptidase
LFVLLNLCVGNARSQETTGPLVPGRQRVMIRSTRDGSLQPTYIIVPSGYNAGSAPAPLIVALHTWSFSIDNQRFQEFEQNAERRNWIYLSPEFRGVDDHPEACGSEIAQQDILDAVAWARSHLKIDEKRIYLWGWSGGGHMALLMASRAPDLWAAVSAWAGITDMAAYYRENAREQPPRTQGQLRACMGGAPGSSALVDSQYSERSPLTHLDRAAIVPIDIWNGRDDDDVSPAHAMLAFNKIARALHAPPITPDEIAQLMRPQGTLDRPQTTDNAPDPLLGHAIFLRRTAGPSRVTIYEGGHMTAANPTFRWFETHSKQ